MKYLWNLALLVSLGWGQDHGKDYVIYFIGRPAQRTIQNQNNHVSIYSTVNLITPGMFSLELRPSRIQVAGKVRNENLLLYAQNDYKMRFPDQTLDHINIDLMVNVLEQRKKRAVLEIRFAYEIPLTAGNSKEVIQFVQRDTSQYELGKFYSLRGIERHFPGMQFQMLVMSKDDLNGTEAKVFGSAMSSQIQTMIRTFQPLTPIPDKIDFWVDYLRTDTTQTKILHRQSFALFRKNKPFAFSFEEEKEVEPNPLTGRPYEPDIIFKRPKIFSSRITVLMDLYGQDSRQTEVLQKHPEANLFFLYIYLVPVSFKNATLDFTMFVERRLENGLVEGFRKDLRLDSGEAVEIELPPIRDNYVFTDKEGKPILINYYDEYSQWIKESIVLKFKR